jgi:hypothetical protein
MDPFKTGESLSPDDGSTGTLEGTRHASRVKFLGRDECIGKASMAAHLLFLWMMKASRQSNTLIVLFPNRDGECPDLVPTDFNHASTPHWNSFTTYC